MTSPNVFSDIPQSIPKEVSEALLVSRTLRIERIISHGQASPKDFWYDQDANEWVIVLKGKARLLFEGERVPLELETGSYVNIPAHKRHRVDWTDPDDHTVWLAVHYASNT